MKLAPLLLILLALPAMAAGVYRWTDAQGNVHYSDQPPPPGSKNTTQKNIKSSKAENGPSQEMQQAKLKNPVTLYVTATCGVHCERAKAHLAKRGIPYVSRDPSTSVDANEALRAGGGQARVPTLMIGSEKLEGYAEAAWDAALDKAGYPPADASAATAPAISDTPETPPQPTPARTESPPPPNKAYRPRAPGY
jgi:glutaredoxin